MTQERERDVGTGLVVGGVGGAAIATVIATLLAARPARAAPTDEKLDYLIEVLTTLVPVLAEVAEGQAELITAMQQWLAAQGIPVAPPAEAVKVTVLTEWGAKEPEQIFYQAIRTADTFYSDRMVSWNKGKRFLIKVESSLDEVAQIQAIGNITEDTRLATDIGTAVDCPDNDNISIGLAWDDWHPYIGIRITTTVAPGKGFLKVWAVVQE